MRWPQRARWGDRVGLRDVLRLLLGVAAQLGLDVRLLLARGRQQIVQLLAGLLGVRRNRAHLGHVRLVGLALAAVPAALHPKDEQDDDEDRRGDQAEQTQERRQPGRARGTARPFRPTRRPNPRHPAALGRFLGRRLVVEEVELDVGSALGHGVRRPEERCPL